MEVAMRALTGTLIHLFFFVSTMALTGCGGGGGGDGTPPQPPPSGLSYKTPQNVRLNTPIAPLSPAVTGTVTGYSISPSLPAGLILDPNTGVIAGTPMQAS